MEQMRIISRLKEILQKYKYVILIVLIGIVLMLWTPQKTTQPEEPEELNSQTLQPETETKLEKILTQIQGAGRVSVMLSVETGEETIYQLNSDQSDTSESRDTVIISGADRAEYGLISQVNPVRYLGAIVVCDGADDPVVRLNIVEAVSKITGLGMNQISVLKMK